MTQTLEKVRDYRGANIAILLHWEKEGDLEAKRHADGRVCGNKLARDALKGLGQAYTGTGGWWILAYATPDKKLGFVDISNGTAVVLDIDLTDELIEICTIEGQTPGPKGSIAIAWAGVDPGAAKASSAPEGWVQLLVDCRENYANEAVAQEAKVLKRLYGLRTCYGHRGYPHAAFDNEEFRYSSPRSPYNWFGSPDQKARVRAKQDAFFTAIIEVCGEEQAAGSLLSGTRVQQDARHIAHQAMDHKDLSRWRRLYTTTEARGVGPETDASLRIVAYVERHLTPVVEAAKALPTVDPSGPRAAIFQDWLLKAAKDLSLKAIEDAAKLSGLSGEALRDAFWGETPED